jgi:superfamily II DNA or RNA helicase
MNQLYILWQLIFPYLKIGSTQNFEKRVSNYITCSPHFDNSSHKIWVFDIIKSNYNCYQLDFIINKLSSMYSYPFKKYDSTGGTEFYHMDEHTKLIDFLSKLNIKFTFKQIDVNELRNKVKQYSKKESIECELEDDEMLHSITDLQLGEIENILKLGDGFSLKPYQIIIRNKVNECIQRLNHIIVSPTGTGKTVIFNTIICDDIYKNKKHVIIVTKKKEILYQIPKRTENYIRLFYKNKIIKKIKCSINNLLDACSTQDFNEEIEEPCIFIVNWDKFTSSNKTDYKMINWKKFSLMIIDESHWCGSNEIHKMMTWIKANTDLNYLGFSATPIRFNQENQAKTLEVFGTGNEYNIMAEYSYYSALINKDICPIKYIPIEISISDLIEGKIEDEGDAEDNEITNKNTPCKILSPDAYNKVWGKIKKNIISKTHFKKGIFWFRTRSEMLTYYIKMNNKMGEFKLYSTMSIKSKEIGLMKQLIKDSGLTIGDFSLAIDNFLSENNNCILLSVMRATEGFDDDKAEFGIRMYYSNTIDPLNESQRMGRFNRWYKNSPNEVKKCGYFGSLELADNKEDIKKSLIQRFRSWFAFAKSYGSNCVYGLVKSEKDKKKEMKELIEMYTDAEVLSMYEIDIEKDIISMMKTMEFDKFKIKHALKLSNSKQSEQINTRSAYDSWALDNNYPLCDELEEKGFNDFKWLFNMKAGDYLTWKDLKKLCIKYQNKYPEMLASKLYCKMVDENDDICPVSMLNQMYKDYNSMKDLFSISM